MIKGINHTVIEVNETGSEYYERALLIIKPEYASVQRYVLESEAKKLLHELDAPSSIRSCRHGAKRILLPLCAAAAGSLITLMILALIL